MEVISASGGMASLKDIVPRMMDFNQVDQAIQEGHLALRDQIEDIRLLLKA